MSFTIYSKPGCPYCEKCIAVLEHEGFTHVVYELEKDFTREEFYSEFGEGSTFPQITLDGIQLGGCRETITYLQEKNVCCNV
jgi:glutaredoxin